MPSALNSPTLVLNRHWTAIHVTSARHALVLAFSERAHIVCPLTYSPYDFPAWIDRGIMTGRSISAARFALEAPEVVVLQRYERVPALSVVFNRRNLYRRDHYTCQYCGTRQEPGHLTIDHVLPISRGGDTSWENCVVACRSCNWKKGSRTPEEAGLGLRRHPDKPHWSPRYAAFARRDRPESWDNFLNFSHPEFALVLESA